MITENKNFTPKEKTIVISMAKEIGIGRAAEKAGVERKTIRNWIEEQKPAPDVIARRKILRKQSNDFTNEEKLQILLRAKEIGYKKAAREAGIKYDTLRSWYRTQKKRDKILNLEPEDEPEDKEKKHFTLEEKTKTISRAKEIGIDKAAFEAGIKIRTLNGWIERQNSGIDYYGEILTKQNHNFSPDEIKITLSRAREIGFKSVANEIGISATIVKSWIADLELHDSKQPETIIKFEELEKSEQKLSEIMLENVILKEKLEVLTQQYK